MLRHFRSVWRMTSIRRTPRSLAFALRDLMTGWMISDVRGSLDRRPDPRSPVERRFRVRPYSTRWRHAPLAGVAKVRRSSGRRIARSLAGQRSRSTGWPRLRRMNPAPKTTANISDAEPVAGFGQVNFCRSSLQFVAGRQFLTDASNAPLHLNAILEGAPRTSTNGRHAAASAVASLPISQGWAAVEPEGPRSRRKAGLRAAGEDAPGIGAARPFLGTELPPLPSDLQQ